MFCGERIFSGSQRMTVLPLWLSCCHGQPWRRVTLLNWWGNRFSWDERGNKFAWEERINSYTWKQHRDPQLQGQSQWIMSALGSLTLFPFRLVTAVQGAKYGRTDEACYLFIHILLVVHSLKLWSAESKKDFLPSYLNRGWSPNRSNNTWHPVLLARQSTGFNRLHILH